MPTRWRLPKSRVSLDEQPGKTETLQTPRWDDFCFDEAIPPISDTEFEERPKTSSGVSGRDRSKSKTRQQIGLTITRPRTSEGRPPSTNYAGYSPSKLEGGMIGVAFGSPTHPPAPFFGNLNDLAAPSTYEGSVFEQAEPMYQIKSRTSAWKKLGSLFKSGKAAADKDDTFEVPFYKLRVENDSFESEIVTRGRKPVSEAVELPARRSPTPPPKDNPRRSIDVRLAQARLEVARLEEAIAEAEKTTIKHEEAARSDPSRPKLDLVIPDIKMDRYSVMFAELKEIPPHSKLLARRSKKLDRLKPISMEDMNQIDKIDTPDTSTLSPRLALPRRATSPSATKATGGFSLFPAAALTPNNMTRQTLTTTWSRPHLKRSITSPARLSPRTEMFGRDKSRTPDTIQVSSTNTVISPGDTTASTDQGTPWSADALLSPTSTVTTIDEDILLSPAKSNKNNEHERHFLHANEAQHMQFLASPTLPRDMGETPEATTPSTSIDPSQEDDYKIQRVASSVFDAAIAEIEAFGVPSFQEQPPLPSPPSAYVPFVLASDEKLATTTERPPPAVSKSKFMMRNMPSPITEAPEESPAPSPAIKRSVAVRPLSEITALPLVPEPRWPAPPNPIKLEKPPMRKIKATPGSRSTPATLPSSIPEVSEESPNSSPEKPRLQTACVQTEQNINEPKHEQTMKMVQTSPAKRKPHAELAQKELKRDLQNSPPRNPHRSNSRQRTNDKAALVLGEILPAPPHQMATLMTGRATSPATLVAEVPPAVPIKDSKFVLPLSRFAVKGTAAEVAQKSGLQASPRIIYQGKPVRSTTEPLTTEHMNNAYPISKPSRLARSASDESLRNVARKPPGKGVPTNHLQRMGMERPSLVNVKASVKPVPVAVGGEIGVARTVSLSRKPSQRILVRRGDGGGGAVGAREASPDERAKKIQARNDHQIPASALRPPRNSSRPRGPMSNLKRSESFKRAIEVGLEDDDEGDMRSGELRARAMSPDVREVMTGLVVNGHKVMKSSVGVIEEA